MKKIVFVGCVCFGAGFGLCLFLYGLRGNPGSEGMQKDVLILPSFGKKRPSAMIRDQKDGLIERDKEGAHGSYQFQYSQSVELESLKDLTDYYLRLDRDQLVDEVSKLSRLSIAKQKFYGSILFTALTKLDPEEALRQSATLGNVGYALKSTILMTWASHSPEHLASYFTENRSEVLRGAAFSGLGYGAAESMIVKAWAKRSPSDALDWIRGLDGESGSRATVALFSEWMQNDPFAAIETAWTLADDRRSLAHHAIARVWAKKDWEEAKKWVESLPADGRDEIMGIALSSLVEKDSAKAANEVILMNESKGRDEAMLQIANSLATDDCNRAAEWMMNHASESIQIRAAPDIVASWMIEDFDKAKAWVGSLAEGKVRDVVLSRFLTSDASGAPAERLERAMTIKDPDSRMSSIGKIARSWLNQDRAAAVQFFQNSDALDDYTRFRLMGNPNMSSDHD